MNGDVEVSHTPSKRLDCYIMTQLQQEELLEL